MENEVDRSARCTTSGRPITDATTEIDPATGMQKDYVVLCEEERRKGFVRPVRRTYQHVGVRPDPGNELRNLTPDEQARYAEYGYVKFEKYRVGTGTCTGRYWTKQQLESGCGTTTSMGQALAETYARDPKFYGGTFCCHCRNHLPVGEFVWDGTDERVGS